MWEGSTASNVLVSWRTASTFCFWFGSNWARRNSVCLVRFLCSKTSNQRDKLKLYVATTSWWMVKGLPVRWRRDRRWCGVWKSAHVHHWWKLKTETVVIIIRKINISHWYPKLYYFFDEKKAQVRSNTNVLLSAFSSLPQWNKLLLIWNNICIIFRGGLLWRRLDKHWWINKIENFPLLFVQTSYILYSAS